jgi:hypothetical membrane protein
MHLDIRKITYRAGLIGSGAIALGALLTALAYHGRAGAAYSVFNHFVSELGEVGISAWAEVFNASLIVGGLSLTVFMLGLAILLGRWFGMLFGILGAVAGISGALVGFFPMNDLASHTAVALTFFNTGWIVTGLFALYVLLARRRLFPRWLAIPGVIATLSSVAFLNSPLPGRGVGVDLASPEIRPDFLAITSLEALVSVVLWRTPPQNDGMPD